MIRRCRPSPGEPVKDVGAVPPISAGPAASRGGGKVGRRLSHGATLGLVALTLSGCGIFHHSFLAAAGPRADATRHEFWFVSAVMLLVIGPVFLLAPIIAWHYRLSNTRHAYRPQWGFSWSLEGLIWIPPTAIVVWLAVYLWRDTHRLDPYRPLPGGAVEVQAIAADWKWIFIYPRSGVATVNLLVIPAGRPVHISLTSATVMQSLLMPQLSGQIYAMAGMRTEINLLADRPGTFMGENTQFNGLHFQDQKFRVEAKDAAGYDRWLAEARAGANRLGVTEYEALTRRDTVPRPLTFGAVAPDLFERVLALKQPSGHTLALTKLPPRPLPMGIDLTQRTSAVP